MCSGEEATLAALPEPSEVAGPTDADGHPEVFVPRDTRPSDILGDPLPMPPSSNPKPAKQAELVPQQAEPAPQQPLAQRPVTAAALKHAAALQDKARAAKGKMAEAEAKMSARQSRYALAEGASMNQRCTNWPIGP